MSLNHMSKYAELTDEHFMAIGRVVVEWSNIEFLLRAVLTRLLLTPDFPGRTFTDRFTAARVQQAIEEAVELHLGRYRSKIVSEELLKEISEVNERITKVRSARNKFAHFCWSRSTDGQIFGTNFSAGLEGSKKQKKSYIVLKIEEINDFYRECYALVDQLDGIVKKLPEMEEDGILKKLTRR